MIYYQFLLEILALMPQDKLLDYGCGNGNLLKYLAEKPHKILAVDSNEDQLDIARQKFENDKIEFKQVTCPSDIKNIKFDKIICHNVLECVHDKLDFINQFASLIDSKGWLVLSHFDFDSAIFNSSYKQFTRDLIHAYADSLASWQTHVDGQIGRKIPHLIKSSNFKNYNYQIIRLAEENFAPNYYGYLFAKMLFDFGLATFNLQELEDWREDLHMQAKDDKYFFAIDLFIGKLEAD